MCFSLIIFINESKDDKLIFLSMKIFRLLLFFSFLCFYSCHVHKPFYAPGYEKTMLQRVDEDIKPIYSIFLIGDTKNPNEDDPLLKLFNDKLMDAGKKSAVVFLGDNVYPVGLPDDEHKLRETAEEDLLVLLKLVEEYEGRIVFIPGNHDWAKGKSNGLMHVKEQRDFIEDHLDRKKVFLPKKGRPGPVDIELTEDIVLIIVDSQWWFHEYEKNYDELEKEADLFLEIHALLKEHKNKKVIFATHHPLFSVGKHGGHFPLTYNLFPLLELNKKMYIPLPGFIYTAYRKFFGHRQDLAHPQYKIFKHSLLGVFQEFPNIIYACGHDHSLQYVQNRNIHHIVSGAGGEATHVARKKRKVDFAYQHRGFVRLNFFDNGDVIARYWIYDEKSEKGIVVFRKKLYSQPDISTTGDTENSKPFFEQIDFSDSAIRISASDKYRPTPAKNFHLGKNYRKEWRQDITLPVFDIGKEKGGMNIVKKGGGMQTRSLRLEDKNGKQYVLRSVDKFAERAIPEELRKTFASDVVQDMISASHPYGFIVVPKLADAAGVYHTNPKIVYLPDDPRLGEYRSEFADGVYMFEERPDDNREDVESFGRSIDIMSYDDAIDNVTDDQDHVIDQEWTLKSRIFDIFLNDWDRHDDQWRWASFEINDTTIYRPIPRDRDQVFFKNEGLLTRIAVKINQLRKFQGFSWNTKDMKGLIYNARHFDRTFLTVPDLEDWIKTAQQLQTILTDSIITEAVKDLPEDIYKHSGEEIITILKKRRDNLVDMARRAYLILAWKVNVRGTDDDDLFEIKRLNDNETEVSVYVRGKDDEKKELLYHRIFKTDETKEIRLYGFKDDDLFLLSGEVGKGITVRIIGGKGKDEVIDKSTVRGLTKKTIVYDKKKKTIKHKGPDTKDKTSKKKDIHKYDRKAYKLNMTLPILAGGYNPDDGLFLGGGMYIKTHGFRKEPYASSQKISAKYAFETGATQFNYKGDFISLIDDFNLFMDANLNSESYVQNFYGYGNMSTKKDTGKDYYRVRIASMLVNPLFYKEIANSMHFFAGPTFQIGKVKDNKDRFISALELNDLDSTIFDVYNYAGISSVVKFDTRDHNLFPVNGIKWDTKFNWYTSLDNDKKSYFRLSSDFSFYRGLFNPPFSTVFAFRIGGSLIGGDYLFFEAPSLGYETNLRGFKRSRFTGEKSLYQNSEIRIKLLNFHNYIVNGQIGMLMFYDSGRVWYKSEKSNNWHHGLGTGIWMSPFDLAVLNVSYARSVEENMITFRFNYLF